MIRKNLKLLVKSVVQGHRAIERPISLLIVLWVVALLVIGVVTKYTEDQEEKDSSVLLEDNSTPDIIKIK